MTLFHGLLLFDIAEPSIGNWEEQLGYRGAIDVWKNKETGKTLIIESYEDCEEHDINECECQEVWIHDEEGNVEDIRIHDSYEKAKEEAKKQMHEDAE